MIGFLWKLIIVDPYPVPASYKYASVILPRTTGVAVITPVATVEIPVAIDTSILGYLKLWWLLPIETKFTLFFLV